ncbi:MAG: transcriptional activator NhaR [Planctomycetes bacterium]|nr:transcriptional activator NhaR [Planctomycetota bacterium]
MLDDWLNYHHLHYFWTTVREGGVSRAARKLGLTQSTVSTQLRQLERALGVQLFERRGRGLVPSSAGKTVFRYAEDIFAIGNELRDALRSGLEPRPERLRVGLVDVVPKLVAYRVLEPVMALEPPMRIHCIEGKDVELHARLAVHELDLVLSDRPLAPGGAVRAWNHLLGESGLSFFARSDRASALRRRFPACLAEEALLMPTVGTSLRAQLDDWLGTQGIVPEVAGEFEDRALINTFGQAGAGIFPGASAIEDQIAQRYGCRVIGRLPEVKERFYAISAERRIKHPALLAIAEHARRDLFATT